MSATHLNVLVLKDVADATGRIPSKLKPTNYPHIKRCLLAGLMAKAPDGEGFILTDAGIAAVAAA